MKIKFNQLKDVLATSSMLPAICLGALVLLLGFSSLYFGAGQDWATVKPQPEAAQKLIALRMPGDSLPPDVNAIKVARHEFEQQTERLKALHEKPEVAAMQNLDGTALKEYCESLKKSGSTKSEVKEYAAEVLNKLEKMEAKNAAAKQ